MMRAMICGLALFALAPAVGAGELDREGTPAKSALVAPADATAKAPAGSEMDKESPRDAYFYRGHWGGWGGGWGYRGFGWGGGWGGWGYRGLGWGGFYPARFYSPGFYGFRSYGFSPWAYRSYYWNWYYPTYSPFGLYGYW
jgi:hypothetical protein